MSDWSDWLGEALDAHGGGAGSVRVDGETGGHAEVDVRAAGPIGVRIGGVRVHHGDDRPVDVEAHRLAHDLTALPHRVAPVEVDPGLGGAVLRSRPEDVRKDDYYEVTVDGARGVEVRRVRVGETGGRADAEWDVTREQLGRLLDQLDG